MINKKNLTTTSYKVQKKIKKIPLSSLKIRIFLKKIKKEKSFLLNRENNIKPSYLHNKLLETENLISFFMI